jgi:hypothetical protein
LTNYLIWEDQTSFEIYGKRGKKTKKQVYKEVLGKKPGNNMPRTIPTSPRRK